MRGIRSEPARYCYERRAPRRHAIVYVNPAFLQITGYSARRSLGARIVGFYKVPTPTQKQLITIRQGIKRQREVQVTIRNYRKDGKWFWKPLNRQPSVRQSRPVHTLYIGIQQDITHQREQEELIAAQRSHDVFNRLIKPAII